MIFPSKWRFFREIGRTEPPAKLTEGSAGQVRSNSAEGSAERFGSVVHYSKPISIKHIFIFQDAYGAFINVDKLPSKEDFEMFDTNEDGTLYYDEWAEAQ